MGFLTDLRMYKTYDMRCLKPNPKVPSSKWNHYEMRGYRAAKNKAELGKSNNILSSKTALQIRYIYSSHKTFLVRTCE